ncbi:MFS transporter [Amphritea balenae]|uniref:MFS transporter n=1 Tax=Amphritea balenae TaxID=452629 RepID=A0A3P1STG5_9GAMM|nr:MFS transporter [Amphritea balenae]RRD00489.1 MFS transporter [Amphritea balenae]GGK70325.1 MFS transporter [Amphritea balenae]
MRISTTFGMNQIVSHGFGVFLFAALVPLMREEIGISHWHLAVTGALTQLSYLAGALLLSLAGHRISSARLALVTGSITSLLLLTMAGLDDPLAVMLVLILAAACAAISWGAIVELISRYTAPELKSTYLSTVSSGTAWGYGLNGLLVLLIVPLFGWRSGWLIAGVLGCTTVLLTWRLLIRLQNRSGNNQHSTQSAALTAAQLFRAVTRERTAFFASLICCLVGFATMPFSTWLSTYLAEQGAAVQLGGYTWTAAGMTGMLAGFLTGKLADSRGHGVALLLVFIGFAIGIIAFVYDPVSFAVIAGCGYGLMYFPMWGIIAGWLNRHYSATATMQINSIGMVVFGLGGASGNLLAGWLQELNGSLTSIYMIIAVDALLLVLIALYVQLTEAKPNKLVQQENALC